MTLISSALDYVRATGGPITTYATSQSYRRRPARLWNQAIAPQFAARYGQLDAVLGWQGLVRFSEATVVGDGYLFTSDGTLISDSIPGGPHAPWPTNQRAAHEQFDRLGASTQAITSERPALLLRQVGAGNYGHWLMDALPRFIAAQRALPELDEVWVHPRNLDLAQRTLQMIAPGVAVRPLADSVRFAHLWWPALCSDPPAVHSPASVPDLRRAFAGWARRSASPRHLFVGRDDVGNRRLTNDDAVWTVLEKRGFTRVNCGSMSISEQIDTFFGADIVVGILGASLTNALFSRSLKRFIVLCPSTMPALFYWDLAHHLSVDIDLIFGRAIDAHNPTGSDFELPISVLEQVLDSTC